MRVGGRIAIGTGFALAILLIILVWDVALVDQLAGVNQALSEVNFRASTLALEQERTLNKIDEFTRKYFVTSDSAYGDRLSDLRLEFASYLADLHALNLSTWVRTQVNDLFHEWDGYRRLSASLQSLDALDAAGTERRYEAQLASLARIQQSLSEVSHSAQTVVLEQALRSAEVSGQARRLSWSIAASALLLCLLILWWTIRSINRPLTLLTRGTEAVAQGEFSVQLETRGRDELSQLATSFNQMVRRLGEAERTKKDFLSHVSHELKTPLASMYETNELLLEEIAGPLNDAQKRFLTLNVDSSRRLSAMISKLLDLSRLEAGVMEYDFRRHDLVALVRTALAGFEVRAREQDVVLELQGPETGVMVDCDRDRMIQVVQNLADNALKFSPEGSTVELRVLPAGVSQTRPDWVDQTDSALSQLSGEMVLLEVADSGPGIPADQKPLVFRRFHQLQNSGSRHPTGGVGLGLTICGEITEAHQGWMGLRDNELTGCVFMVALPAVESSGDVGQETGEVSREEAVVA